MVQVPIKNFDYYILQNGLMKFYLARSPVRLQPLQLFDQKEFFNESQNVGLDTAGFLYVPRECRNGRIRCYLHFYFHGCTVGR